MPKWFAHELEALRKLEGKSASEMVREMRKLRPEVTRNGIIGVCARNGIRMGQGLSGAQEKKNGYRARVRLKSQGLAEIGSSRKGAVRKSLLAPVQPRAPYFGRPEAWVPINGITPIPFDDRRAHQCAWPIGAPAEPISVCCGAPVQDGTLPYCAEHRRLRLARYVPAELAELDQLAA
jgi:hypothetical protein